MSVRRKCAELLQYFNPFAAILASPPQDEALPAAKRPRLEASTSVSTVVAEDTDTCVDAQAHHMPDATLTAPPNDTVAVAPTDVVTVTVAASLPRREHDSTWKPRPSTGASYIRRERYSYWKPEEDATLTEAVKKHGANWNWNAVAALVPGRTKQQCRQRWAKSLNPDISTSKWQPEEDAKLTEAVKKHGDNWNAVAALVPRRTNVQCRYRWVESLDPDITLGRRTVEGLDPTIGKTTGRWTVEEDAKLTEAVKKLGTNWIQVAAMVPGRTKKQCRYRWVESLDPDITLGKWTVEGFNPGKTRGKWTVEGDAKLTEAVKKLGTNWVQVAAMVPGRTKKQCRYRWVESLDPDITLGKWTVEGLDLTTGKTMGRWTVEEDAMLTEAITELGNDWRAIAALVPGRTNVAL
jgi:hypothetical protein